MEDLIKNFVKVGSGSGDGSGDGSGYGSGYGYGYGSGDGYGDGSGYGSGYGYGDGSGDGYGDGSGSGSGSGDGYGDGSGYGSGYGSGIKSINGQNVYLIDSVQTVITQLKNNLAKGFILGKDLSLTPCFIAKVENLFAHGETAREAFDELQKKLFLKKPISERLLDFKKQFSSKKKYHASEFYKWHTFLTGSCDLGKKAFCKDNNISLDSFYTVSEFIEIVKESYGGDIIKQLK